MFRKVIIGWLHSIFKKEQSKINHIGITQFPYPDYELIPPSNLPKPRLACQPEASGKEKQPIEVEWMNLPDIPGVRGTKIYYCYCESPILDRKRIGFYCKTCGREIKI